MKSKNNIIGVDIGGTKIRSLLYSAGKIKLVKQYKTPKNQKKFEQLLNTIIKFYNNKSIINGVGIGIAGKVVGKMVISCANIPYLDNLNLSKVITKHNIKVDNDARCFARAEYLIGTAKKAHNILAFTVGTGVGRAYGINGKIKKIKQFVSREKWEKKYQKIRDQKSYDKLAKLLGNRLVNIIDQYKPEQIVFGGGVLKAESGIFFLNLKKQLRVNNIKSTIKKSEFGDNAAALGAALLFAK